MLFFALSLFLYLALLPLTGAKAVIGIYRGPQDPSNLGAGAKGSKGTPSGSDLTDPRVLSFGGITPTCQKQGKKAPVEAVEDIISTFRGHYFRHGELLNSCSIVHKLHPKASDHQDNGKTVYEEQESFQGASILLGVPNVWADAMMECSRVADYLEAIIKKCAKDGLVGGYIPVLAKEYDSRKDFRVKADSGGLEVFVTSDFYCDRNTTGLDSTDRCIFVY